MDDKREFHLSNFGSIVIEAFKPNETTLKTLEQFIKSLETNSEVAPLPKNKIIALLNYKDDTDRTLIHYAARYKYLSILQWVQKNAPKRLTQQDAMGRTIGHYAAWGGNADILDWLEKYYPKILSQKDANNNSIFRYAAASENAECISMAVKFLKLENVTFAPHDQKRLSDNLDAALTTNYSITTMTIPTSLPEQTKADVNNFLERNKMLHAWLPVFKVALQGVRQNESILLNLLPNELLFHIFCSVMPENMNSTLTFKIFDTLMKKMSPLQHQKNLVQKILDEEISQLSHVSLSKKLSSFFCEKESNKKFIKALEHLKGIIVDKKSDEVSIQTGFIKWYQDNSELFSLEKSKSQTNRRDVFIEIKSILNIQEKIKEQPSFK